MSRMTVSEAQSTITHSKQVPFLIALTLNFVALQQNVGVTKRVNKNRDIMKCRSFAWYDVHFRRHSRFFPVVRKYGSCQRQPSRRANKPTYLESRERFLHLFAMHQNYFKKDNPEKVFQKVFIKLTEKHWKVETSTLISVLYETHLNNFRHGYYYRDGLFGLFCGGVVVPETDVEGFGVCDLQLSRR